MKTKIINGRVKNVYRNSETRVVQNYGLRFVQDGSRKWKAVWVGVKSDHDCRGEEGKEPLTNYCTSLWLFVATSRMCVEKWNLYTAIQSDYSLFMCHNVRILHQRVLLNWIALQTLLVVCNIPNTKIIFWACMFYVLPCRGRWKPQFSLIGSSRAKGIRIE